MLDEIGYGLKEIAVNVKRQDGEVILEIGIIEAGEKLLKRRISAVKRIFREIGFPKKLYRIHVVKNEDRDDPSWICGQNELWVRLAETGQFSENQNE